MSNAIESGASANVFLNRKPVCADRALSKLETQIVELEERVEAALAEMETIPAGPPAKPEAVKIWGVPFSRLTLGQTLQHVDRLIAARQPGYFITANLNYNMLTAQHPPLRQVNDDAAFIVCDGMPMVWRSRWTNRPLPERVAGSELIYALTQWSAHKNRRIYFLGGAPGVAQAAADKLSARYPGLIVAGVHSPPFRPLSEQEHADLIEQIRSAEPDIVYVAMGQPKGELWIAENYRAIGAPVCVQIGASFDFVAGGVARAPRWLQRAGLEWCYRMLQEPRRLARRYWHNGMFLLKALSQESCGTNR
ncbi:Putative N-acetylmannosaminyltransferase [Rosistilla carotiformis]|uniref:N-acetylmannosaminyltransferase n=1 Tax=Rosistilla carotiformis TaxID=2528017 RepID=A0A518JZT1_9BACT|nr:WecB/TagA/CpsF family glycosyltransferase [Rosistilla carotiformis]QDV71056.1 Putative N-acetylmannosaminyltransferase [Rosistilla carotiformis]